MEGIPLSGSGGPFMLYSNFQRVSWFFFLTSGAWEGIGHDSGFRKLMFQFSAVLSSIYKD